MKGFLLPLSVKEGSIFSIDITSWKKETQIKNSCTYYQYNIYYNIQPSPNIVNILCALQLFFQIRFHTKIVSRHLNYLKFSVKADWFNFIVIFVTLNLGRSFYNSLSLPYPCFPPLWNTSLIFPVSLHFSSNF